MRELLGEPLAELLGVVVYAAIAGALTVVGALTELASVGDIAAGQSFMGVWEIALGGVLLYLGVSVARDFVVPSLREFRNA